MKRPTPRAATKSPPKPVAPVTIELNATIARYLKTDVTALADDLTRAAQAGDLEEVIAITTDMQCIARKVLEFEGSRRKAGAK
jgi:hypothetical protein